MKNLLLLATGTALLLGLSYCKNTPLPEGQTIVSENTTTGAQAPAAPLPMGKLDSLTGFKGCDRATWSPLTANSEEFIYQHYTVVITRNNDQPGEQITVKRDSGRADFVIPMPEAGYFKGVCRNKLFVDEGTGPDGRRLVVFDLDKNLQFFSTDYCGEPQIIQSERVYYLLPVDEKDVTRIPDCPEKEQWIKDGLKVGYGQRCIFNLLVRTNTRKSEWACVAMQ
ncbi:MAG TPA: hypothetical protein PK228_09895 [Saprospiraceae bacterium]|nr:hypothetical protein [Saprospiraceae bacterium]